MNWEVTDPGFECSKVAPTDRPRPRASSLRATALTRTALEIEFIAASHCSYRPIKYYLVTVVRYFDSAGINMTAEGRRQEETERTVII